MGLAQAIGQGKQVARQFCGNDEGFKGHLGTIPLGAADWEGVVVSAALTEAPPSRSGIRGMQT
jgi:hypothetical protein